MVFRMGGNVLGKEGEIMYIVLGIILIIIGGMMIINPKLVWEITESWKNDRSAEPSNFYKINVRIGGGVFLLVGLAGVIYSLSQMI